MYSFDFRRFRVGLVCLGVCPGITNISQCSCHTSAIEYGRPGIDYAGRPDRNSPAIRSYFLGSPGRVSSSHSYSVNRTLHGTKTLKPAMGISHDTREFVGTRSVQLPLGIATCPTVGGGTVIIYCVRPKNNTTAKPHKTRPLNNKKKHKKKQRGLSYTVVTLRRRGNPGIPEIRRTETYLIFRVRVFDGPIINPKCSYRKDEIETNTFLKTTFTRCARITKHLRRFEIFRVVFARRPL